MPDAWEWLVASSRLNPSPDNDAWDHLTHSGGIGEVFGDGVEVMVEQNEIEVLVGSLEDIEVFVTLEPEMIEVEIDEELDAVIDDDDITGEV
jgi:hypothetical protein